MVASFTTNDGKCVEFPGSTIYYVFVPYDQKLYIRMPFVLYKLSLISFKETKYKSPSRKTAVFSCIPHFPTVPGKFYPREVIKIQNGLVEIDYNTKTGKPNMASSMVNNTSSKHFFFADLRSALNIVKPILEDKINDLYDLSAYMIHIEDQLQ